MPRKIITLELRLEESHEELSSDVEYFLEDIKELFEHHGWKITWNSVEDEGKNVGN